MAALQESRLSHALDTLNAWVARPLAWAQPLERPTPRERHLAIRALVETTVIGALCPLLQAPDALPFAVETALRGSAGTPLDDAAWLGWLEALERHAADHLPAVGLAAEARQMFEGPLADTTWPRLLQLAEQHAGAAQSGWCWVQELEGDEAIVRPLVGTGHPSLEKRPARGLTEAGQLVLWRDDADPIPVPRWLARWDTRARTLRVFAGRAPTSGRPRYRGWLPDDLSERNALPADAPPFLADLGWSTPAPATRQLPVELGPDGAHVRATHHMAAERVAAPRPIARPAAEAPPVVPGAQLVLKVLGGRHALRYAPLTVDHPVVVGRSAQHATLVLQQHQISRAHTRVRLDDAGRILVSDLGSTNGTQRNGTPVTGEVACVPGDLLAIGPVPTRIEYLPPDQQARLDLVLGIEPDDDRDPLTHLLESRALADHVPAPLRATFREGGPADDGPELWGILAYVDRLAALHAQHGEQMADGVFSVVARLVQVAAQHPHLVTRVGYGEILVPWFGDEAGARTEAQRLMEAVASHPWGPKVRDLSLTAALARKEPHQAANPWLASLRQQLQEGRRKGGRGHLY